MGIKTVKSIVILSIAIIVSGILVVSNSMPKFIKDNSKISIDYSFSPLDFKIETNKYSIDMNGNTFCSLKDKAANAIFNAGDGIKSAGEHVVSGVSDRIDEIKTNVFQK